MVDYTETRLEHIVISYVGNKILNEPLVTSEEIFIVQEIQFWILSEIQQWSWLLLIFIYKKDGLGKYVGLNKCPNNLVLWSVRDEE